MPSPTLHSRLADLATSFADEVLAAIRTASLHELTGDSRRARAAGGGGQPDPLSVPIPKRTKGGRLARRTPQEIDRALGLVVAALKAGPMRAEEIRSKLALDKRELPRVLKQGLATKKLKAKGQKRATEYSVK